MKTFDKRVSPRAVRNRMIIRLLLILLIISIGIIWLSRSSAFKVSQVNVSWDEGKFLVPEAEKRLKDNIIHKIIFLVGQNQIGSVPEDFPVIQKVKIIKNYPATVNLSILTRRPSMAVIPITRIEEDSASPSAILRLEPSFLSASSSAETYLLDSAGLVFWQGTNLAGQDLIRFFIAGDFLFKIGQSVNEPSIQAGFKFIGLYQKVSADLEMPRIVYLLSLSPETFVVKLVSGTFVYLPQTENYGDLANNLKLILGKYQIEGKHLKKVDLRFKNPVVEY